MSTPDSQRIDDWLVFNCGRELVSEGDLQLSQPVWVGKYNTPWHNSTFQIVQQRLAALREKGLVQSSDVSDGFVVLSESGVEAWKRLAEPDFEKAYEWSCADSNLPGCDFRISIAAPTMQRVLEIFCNDWNTSFFEVVASGSLQIEEDCEFSAAYWHRAKGVRLSFDAADAERSLSKVYKASEVGIPGNQWYQEPRPAR